MGNTANSLPLLQEVPSITKPALLDSQMTMCETTCTQQPTRSPTPKMLLCFHLHGNSFEPAMFQGCGHSLAHWLYNKCDSARAKFTQQCGHHQKSVHSHMGNMNQSLAATLLCVVIPSLSVQSYFWNKLPMKQIFKSLPVYACFQVMNAVYVVTLKDHGFYLAFPITTTFSLCLPYSFL
jgi:hypothetical protein